MNKKIDWEDCKKRRIAKEVNVDTGLVNYIIESAGDREKTTNMLPINNTTKETVVSLMYDVLRELLEALSIKRGYKIYNHECYAPFLRSIIGNEDFSRDFDALRLLRNSINYYGRKISLDESKETLNTIKDLIKKARLLLEQTITSS